MTAPNSRRMRLTPELVARVAPYVGAPRPLPGTPPSDADYDAAVREILADAPSREAVRATAQRCCTRYGTFFID